MTEQFRSLPQNFIESVIRDTSTVNERIEPHLEKMGEMYRRLGFTDVDIAKNQERHRRGVLNNVTKFNNPDSPEVRALSEGKDTREIKKRAEKSLYSFFEVAQNIVPIFLSESVNDDNSNDSSLTLTAESHDVQVSQYAELYDEPIIRQRK